MEWNITKENLDVIRKVAKEWEPGVIILKPFNGDFVFLAAVRVDMYNPSDNIHHTTIEGKDITLMVSQRLDTARLQGKNPTLTYINNIEFEDIWEIPSHEKFLWIKLRQRI